MTKLWHGLSAQQWITLWDSHGFTRRFRKVLQSIATDPRAGAKDRTKAIQYLNLAMVREILRVDHDFPAWLHDTLMSIAESSRPGSKSYQERIHAQIVGARFALLTMIQILELRHGTEATETLLS